MAVPKMGEAWSSHDPEQIAALYTEDGVRWEPAFPGRRLEGRAAIAQGVKEYQLYGVPDEKVEVRNVIEGKDGTVVVEWTFRGTHTRDLPNLPAKGEKMDLVGVSVCEMKDGLIKEEHCYWDTATLMAGAGVLG